MATQFIEPLVAKIEVLDLQTAQFTWQIRLARVFASSPNAATTLADITEANFSGYAPVDANFGAAADIGDGINAGSLSDVVTFTRGVGATSNTIVGVYVCRDNAATPANLRLVYEFPTPIPMVTPFVDVISLSIKWLQGQFPL